MSILNSRRIYEKNFHFESMFNVQNVYLFMYLRLHWVSLCDITTNIIRTQYI